MSSQPRTPFRAARPFGLALAGLVAGLSLVQADAAKAQGAAGCADIQKYLLDRKSIAASLTPKKGKQMDATFACAGFGRLVSNGNVLIKWVDGNKEWCQIPASFVDGIKTDHTRAIAIRAKACGIAAKGLEMQKRAREAGGGSGGLLGGGGLEGTGRIPQGAL